ncbi:MAG: hypothetical protein JSU01_08995 [Bacteroidetes bacterium]|nr:hypothetical protein [Bacteroidota bacterium]
MNPKGWFSLVFILLFAAFLFFARKAKYDEFHKAEIKGKIDTIYRYRDYVMIYVNNIEYRIIPVPLDHNGVSIYDVGSKGDSLIKSAGRDTFIVKHQGGLPSTSLYTVKTH